MQNIVHRIDANKLRAWRKVAAMNGSKSEVARLSGVSRMTIDNILRTGRGRKTSIDRVEAAFQQIGQLII